MQAIKQANPFESSNGIAISFSNHSSRNPLPFSAGDIFSGVITDQSDGMKTVSVSDQFSFTVRQGDLQGEMGDEVFFECLGNTQNGPDGTRGLKLKQVNTELRKESWQQTKQADAEEVRELFKQSRMIPEDKKGTGNDAQNDRIKEARAMAKIRRQLQYGANNAGADVVRELLKAGLSLEKISLDVLTGAMAELEKNGRDKPEAPEAARNVRRYMNDQPSDMHKDKKQHAKREKLARVIAEEGLPLTDENMRGMEGLSHMLEGITALNDRAAADILREDRPVTLGRVYAGQYSSASNGGKIAGQRADRQTPALDAEAKKELSAALDAYFQREEIPPTQENKEAACFLIDHSVSVTRTNMERLRFLQNITGHLDKEAILREGAARLKNAGSFGDIVLFGDLHGEEPPESVSSEESEILYHHYEELISHFPSASGDAVETIRKNGEPITMRGLRLFFSADRSEKDSGELTPAVITARRQLAEIRLKLTYEAAHRLAGRNIDIDVMPLENALQALRDMERESYGGHLRTMGAEDSEANRETLQSLYTKIAESNPLTCQVFSRVVRDPSTFTITGIHASVLAARAAENYEAHATVPNPRYGDSFALVRGQFARLLEELGMEATDDNVKAAVILSRNEIDVTPENMAEVKCVGQKIRTVFNRLHPYIAASMVKEGIEPAELHVDDVLAYIDRFENEFGDGLADQIPRLILEADEKKTLPPEQRETMLSLYRMLNTIERNGGAAYGVALRHGADPTLGNLLEASRYFTRTGGKRGDVDIAVDDGFGFRTDGVSENHKRNSLQYTALKLKELAGNASLSALEALAANVPDMKELSLEAAADRLEQFREASENQLVSEAQNMGRSEEGLARLQTMLSVSASTVRWMELNGIPPKMGYLYAAEQIRKDSFYTGKKINDTLFHADKTGANRLDRMEQEPDPAESLRGLIMDSDLIPLREGQSVESVWDETGEALLQARDTGVSESLLREFTLAQNAVQVQRYAQGKQNGFSFPLRLNDKISELHVLLMSGELSAEKNETLIALDTSELGVVNAALSVDGERVSVRFSSDSADGMEALRTRAGLLETALAEAGYAVGEIVYMMTKG